MLNLNRSNRISRIETVLFRAKARLTQDKNEEIKQLISKKRNRRLERLIFEGLRQLLLRLLLIFRTYRLNTL